MNRRTRTVLVNLALAATSILLAFAVPEAILRVVRPRIAHDLFSTVTEHLPGLSEMVADTQRYSRAHGIRQPPNFMESSDLLWSLKPGYDETITRIPWVEGEKRTWRLRVNALGLRGPDVKEDKPPGVLRIVCLGDSITFGDKLDQGETIPERMQAILAARQPDRHVEVINAAVPGYSSRQGLALWQKRVRDLHPDVVMIAFGFNDRWPSAVSDAKNFPPDVPGLGPAIGRLRRTETYKTLRALILALRRRIGTSAPNAPLPHRTRVSLHETEANTRALVRDARAAGARVVVVHTAIGQEAIRQALTRVARQEGVAFVDAAGALARAKDARQRALAARLGISGRCPDPPKAPSGFLFRAIVPPSIPRRGDLHARAFGGVLPMDVPLTDDGRGCDERAGDGVWTGWMPAPAGATFYYLFAQEESNRILSDEFNGFPWAWRTATTGPLPGHSGNSTIGATASSPIDTYNRYDLMSEEIHPNAEGADVMARAIADAVH